jgi:LacI family transcriptional regulator
MPNQAALHLRHSKSRIIGLYFSSISAATSPYVLHSVLTGVYGVIGGALSDCGKGN